jgi:hypothetical protein
MQRRIPRQSGIEASVTGIAEVKKARGQAIGRLPRPQAATTITCEPLEASTMTPAEDVAFAFGQEMLDFAIDLVKAASVPSVTSESRRDPVLIGLSLLCRSITNFRGALVLARDNQPVESRALVRLIFENFFFVAALCERGADFVKRMRSDEAANRKTLGELSLKRLTVEHKDGEHAQSVRTQIRGLLDEFPKPRKFGSVSSVAAETVADHAYLSYAVLSMDAHPSISTLRRHLQWELEGDTRYLTLSVVPRFNEKERLRTVDEACNALLGVCVAVNQLLGGTSKNDALRELFERFEARAPRP